MSDEERLRLQDDELNPGTVFQMYLESFDDYALPEVVTDGELDRIVAEGAVEIFRGMPDSQRKSGYDKNDQVMHDTKYYTGNGIFGDGLYFAENSGVAYDYAMGRGTSGSIMRAALKPGARTISYDMAKANALYEIRKTYPDAEWCADGLVSAIARAQGYDVITEQNTGAGTYYNVLNRGALYISDK